MLKQKAESGFILNDRFDYNHILPVYDVFTCNLSGDYLVDYRDFPVRTGCETLNGRFLCLIAPGYTGSRIDNITARMGSTELGEPIFIYDNHYLTTNIVFKIDDSTVSNEVEFVLDAIKYEVCIPTTSVRGGLVAAATCIRVNEQLLPQWIDFHWSLGIDHFFIYYHGAQNVSSLLDQYLRRELVTIHNWPYTFDFYTHRMLPRLPESSHLYFQCPQMVHTIRRYGENWKWIAFFDCDEYLNPSIPLPDILSKYEQAASLSMPGKLFGEGSLTNRPEVPNFLDYDRAEIGCTSYRKVITSPRRVQSALIHWIVPVPNQRSVDLPADLLHFNHYRLMSHEWAYESRVNADHNVIEDQTIRNAPQIRQVDNV